MASGELPSMQPRNVLRLKEQLKSADVTFDVLKERSWNKTTICSSLDYFCEVLIHRATRAHKRKKTHRQDDKKAKARKVEDAVTHKYV